MAAPHGFKRQRAGGAYRDTIPLADDYTSVFSREVKLRKIGYQTLPAHEDRSAQENDTNWATTTAWTVQDDTEFALDPDGTLYDEILEADVISESTTDRANEKLSRSRVSKRPNVLWKELHIQDYLDEILRWAGRADFRISKACPDCISRKSEDPGLAQYRCKECFIPDLVCSSCCVKRHRLHPFHRIESWEGGLFKPISLKSLGLKIQLNHGSLFCENPVPCRARMLVLHSNGFHEVAIQYCGCTRAIPQHHQLLRRGLYPATQLLVATCATFELLDLLHKLALTTKSSTYDFYRALEKMTDNTGLNVPTTRYRALMRMSMQWRHLKMLKWGGRGHDPAGAAATAPGELAVLCPSCPRPGINLPPNWNAVSADQQFLYMMFTCMDANFRLKNQMVSNWSQDPGLGIGLSYMVPRIPYEKYVLSRANDGDLSTCVGLQALSKAHTKFSVGLRSTGVGGAMCGRSEMILPNGIGALQKGERYANMDYIFASAIQAAGLCVILISYDIACQWFVNLFKRMQEHWPVQLRVPPSTRLIPAIPKLHEPMHGKANHEGYSLNFIRGVGKSDLEAPERVWGSHNLLGNSTKTQGPGSCQDVYDDHFGFWNWLKYHGLGQTLKRRYVAAVAERNVQTEGHRGLTQSLDPQLVDAWEVLCREWEEEVAFPKKKLNPFQISSKSLSEAEIRKELAEAEETRLAAGGLSFHEITPSAFVVLGLELEHMQRRVRLLAQATGSGATARAEAGLTAQRNILRSRLRSWEQLQAIYMPGLLHYRASCIDAQAPPNSSPNSTHHPENTALWLPSSIPDADRLRVCIADLPSIEEQLRTAQCHDALENIRHILKVKSRMVMFKNKNVRGQRDGTRSRTVIDRVHERARTAAGKYRAARQAKLALSGPGQWEDELRVLGDGDIRAYQDPNRLRPRMGRRGTFEDDHDHARAADGMEGVVESENNISLLNQPRNRRDGTGETRRTLSWIWTTSSRSPNPDDETDDILRSEWAKSRARVNRSTEEVLLLREEMRRTLEFLEWRAKWWMERRSMKSDLSKELGEGLEAYASGQAALQRALADNFRTLWKSPLDDAQQIPNFVVGEDLEDPDEDGDDIDDGGEYTSEDEDDE